MSRLCLVVLLLSACPLTAWAQVADGPAPNVAVLSELAVGCLPETGSIGVVALDAPSRLPFLRGALVASLQSRGVDVLTEPDSGVVSLEVDLQRAGVSYSRAGGGHLSRTVSLAVAVVLVDGSGLVQHDTLCTPSAEDRIPRALVSDLEETAYPETQGVVPLSFWHRAVQPAVITLATAAGTVLFFSLRSRRSDGS